MKNLISYQNPQDSTEIWLRIRTIYGILEDSDSKAMAKDFVARAKDKNETSVAIITDIFRASTTLANLLDCGAKYIVLKGDPNVSKKIIEFKREKREDVYFGIGSDGNGEVIFEIPNSPSIVRDKESSIKWRIGIMSTSKGTEAILNANESGFDKILIGSYPSTNAIVSYLNNAKKKKGLAIMVVATEWKYSSNSTPTEDSIYADFVSHLLTGKDVEFDDFMEMTIQTQGARRFRKNIPFFPLKDIELAVKEPSYFSFFPAVRQINDIIIVTKSRSMKYVI